MYVAAPIFKAYWNNNHFWLRRIMNNLLNHYDTSQPFKVEAPTTVEANLMEKDGVRYLHLINFHNGHTGSRKQALYDPIESITPVHDIKVTLHSSGITEVVQQPEGNVLELRQADKGYEVTVPRLHIHSVLEIR
ncbi:hypothetical protein [Paenibacillus periandrae]|uniref:hypothetical protein n=1 Tax=Paenibacillus periandrae TaxID=1761741 RepID=UPI001F095EF0|nr:hypothetical protein [Paenibacillus periandrae]